MEQTLTQAEDSGCLSKVLSEYEQKRERVKRSLWAQCDRFYKRSGMGQDAIALTLNSALGFPADGVHGGKLADSVQNFLKEMEEEGLIRVQVVERRTKFGSWLTIWAIAPGSDAA